MVAGPEVARIVTEFENTTPSSTANNVNHHEQSIDVQYRRLESNGKTDFHVVQIALFLKYRSTCLSMVSDTVKWSRMDSIRLSLVKWSNGVLLPKMRGRKASESNGSNRSNGVEWTPFD